jgi:choline transport protein
VLTGFNTVFFSLATFVVIIVASLARTSPNFQPAEAVWNTFVNKSGWADSVAFLTGLVNANYMYAGIDGAIHLAEECKNAAVVVPQALISTILIGFVTSLIFAVVMLYCTSDLEAAVATATGYVSVGDDLHSWFDV